MICASIGRGTYHTVAKAGDKIYLLSKIGDRREKKTFALILIIIHKLSSMIHHKSSIPKILQTSIFMLSQRLLLRFFRLQSIHITIMASGRES